MVSEIPNIQVTRFDSNGQLTISAELREELGLTDGDPVVIERHDGCLIIRRATVVEQTAGALSAYRRETPLTPREERELFERGVAEENASID